MNESYPLLLRADAQNKVWGGRNLERWLNKTLPPGELIGETWETWDGNVVENGPARGGTLGQLIERDPAAMLGAAQGHRLPLRFKFIDAHEDLSVQVHPDDASAQVIEHEPFGKTEAWYILHAEPGAQLIHGFARDVDAGRVTEHLHKNRLSDLLAHVSVQSGDVILVPAGTVHAIMRGIVLAEIQQNSDTTYRLYDWGRTSRELHIAQSLRVARFARQDEHKIPGLTIHRPEFDQRFLVACRYFSFELWSVKKSIGRIALDDRFDILSVIDGTAMIDDVAAQRGQTIFLPASLEHFSIVPTSPSCKILRAYVPDLRVHVIEPLRRAGLRDDEIVRLGGAPQANDLLNLTLSP